MSAKTTITDLSPEVLSMIVDIVYKNETGGLSFMRRLSTVHFIIFNDAAAYEGHPSDVKQRPKIIPSVEQLELLEPARCLVQFQLISKRFQNHVLANFGSQLEKEKKFVIKVRKMFNETQILSMFVHSLQYTSVGELKVKNFKLLVSLARNGIRGELRELYRSHGNNNLFDRNFDIIQRDE